MQNPLMVLSRRGRRVWLGLALLYLVTQGGRRLGVVSGLADHHLTDLLCLPLVLGAALMLHRRVGQALPWRLPWWHGLVGVFGFSLHFEVLLPRVDRQATADPIDSICYLLGWVLFELLINRPLADRREVRDSCAMLIGQTPQSVEESWTCSLPSQRVAQ